MTVLPFAFPRTNDWLERRLDLRARLQLRTALRRLERGTDARLVVLWSVENSVVTKVVELAGDDDVMPTPLPILETSIPSREPTRDRHREEHDTVSHKIRMGGDAPTLGLAIVVPGRSESMLLFDAVESVAEQIEGVVVEATERADRVQAREVAARERVRARERSS